MYVLSQQEPFFVLLVPLSWRRDCID